MRPAQKAWSTQGVCRQGLTERYLPDKLVSALMLQSPKRCYAVPAGPASVSEVVTLCLTEAIKE